MSFFVSKDIEERLDEETLSEQTEDHKNTSEYCQLCVNNNETLCYYRIKKIDFFEDKKVEVVVESDAKFAASVLSSQHRIDTIQISGHAIQVAEYTFKSGEINNNGSYDFVISCLTE